MSKVDSQLARKQAGIVQKVDWTFVHNQNRSTSCSIQIEVATSVSQLEATEIVHKKSKHLVWVTLVAEAAC
jgi:hypothetical protein